MALKDILTMNDKMEEQKYQLEEERIKRDMELAEKTHARMLEIVKKQIVKAGNVDKKDKDAEKDLIDLVDLHAYISKMEPKKRYLLKIDGQV